MGRISRKITTEGGSNVILYESENNNLNLCLDSGANWLDVELTRDEAKQLVQLIKETVGVDDI